MFYHIGHECDGRWVQGPFKTLEAANASLTEYTGEHSDRLNAETPMGRVFFNNFGGRHVVEEFPATLKTAKAVEDYLEAFDARECGTLTHKQETILSKNEYP